MSEKKIHIITSAHPSASEEQAKRMRFYLVVMIFRVFAFILAVVLTNPFRWLLIIFAILIPYISVIKANTKDDLIASDRDSLMIGKKNSRWLTKDL